MFFVENKFEIGDIVYLKTDPDQLPLMCVGFIVSPTGIMYRLTCGDDATHHYECEISTDKNYSLSED